MEFMGAGKVNPTKKKITKEQTSGQGQDDVQININPPVEVANNFLQNNDGKNNAEDSLTQQIMFAPAPPTKLTAMACSGSASASVITYVVFVR